MAEEIKPKKPGVGFGVMLLKGNKILLGKRHEDPEKADSVFKVSNCWTMPGGKFDYGESFEEGTAREVLEETGIKLNSIEMIGVNSDINEHAHFITLGFLSEDFEGDPKVMEPDEITEWQWFDLNNLPQNMYFPSTKVLENYKKGKFYIKPLKNIEIELRSFISKEDYERLLRFFREKATLVKEDFQETHYFNSEQDLRIQKNNFGCKIWLKKGKIHDEAREELEIKLTKEDFEKVQELFAILNYGVSIKWLRDRKQFDWEGIKVCLDLTKGYGYIIELEKIGSELDKVRILEELRQKFIELRVPLTPREEFERKFEDYKNNWQEKIK
ncbi:ADP-ribose pyrophosphatase [uncultured archaeon]|nr:ADP-ribose pyrophosphatase [uncultured archaeon]